MKKTLPQLLVEYGRYTDKEVAEWGGHGYGAMYEHLLGPIKPIRNILEIGCQFFGGGGLLAFAERFPEATVAGLDVTFDNLSIEAKSHPRIRTFQGDAYQDHTVTQFRQEFTEDFDLIIEDAVHVPEFQERAFSLYSKLLSPHGIYVIEDVSDLDDMSKRLVRHNDEWVVILGDCRKKAPCPSGFLSILVALTRRNNIAQTG